MRNIEPRYELDIVEKSVKGFVYFCIGASLFCLGGLIGSQRAIGIYMEILNEERERLRAISEIYYYLIVYKSLKISYSKLQYGSKY